MSFSGWVDIRTIGASYFQILTTLCSMSRTIIDDTYKTFRLTQYINDRVISPTRFYQDTVSIINSFLNLTINDFLQMKRLIDSAIDANQFLIGTNMNGVPSITNNKVVIFKEVPFYMGALISERGFFINGSCWCSLDYSICVRIPMLFGNRESQSAYVSVFPGFSIRCRPSFGLYRSKIDWWYNETVLYKLWDSYRFVIPVTVIPPNIKALKFSASRYRITSETAELVDGMFIETWNTNNTRFDLFYEQCAPISCSYTIVEQRGMIIALLLIISILSGLNKLLRLIVPIIINIVFFLRRKWRNLQFGYGMYNEGF
ncbi:unnamed protein product [Rotaria sp. Silwood2]|nr:unnamed protein product [Rotaria sp. Silwood2]CAF2922667.1 unnamed protein product [Rotaria sp. Silwood2]CAF3156559.1 unnamed protein product [Rotaria sp. Silwood2]CAF3318285.1 unnamed protein product [Rotaria sp. Silwood2]CAF4288721.1 unnamed protein product [Rotaria sp. Silwood2]